MYKDSWLYNETKRWRNDLTPNNVPFSDQQPSPKWTSAQSRTSSLFHSGPKLRRSASEGLVRQRQGLSVAKLFFLSHWRRTISFNFVYLMDERFWFHSCHRFHSCLLNCLCARLVQKWNQNWEFQYRIYIFSLNMSLSLGNFYSIA